MIETSSLQSTFCSTFSNLPLPFLQKAKLEGMVCENHTYTHTYPHRIRLYRLRNGSGSWEGKNKVFLGEAKKAAER